MYFYKLGSYGKWNAQRPQLNGWEGNVLVVDGVHSTALQPAGIVTKKLVIASPDDYLVQPGCTFAESSKGGLGSAGSHLVRLAKTPSMS